MADLAEKIANRLAVKGYLDPVLWHERVPLEIRRVFKEQETVHFWCVAHDSKPDACEGVNFHDAGCDIRRLIEEGPDA